MGERVLLCVDSRTKQAFPERRLGAGLDSSWLACETKAQACRSTARSCAHVEEVWVDSCDDMEPINIAAAIKHDDPHKKVFLISDGQNGSLASRAANAGIDALWSRAMFERRYAEKKAEFSPPESVFSCMGAGGGMPYEKGGSRFCGNRSVVAEREISSSQEGIACSGGAAASRGMDRDGRASAGDGATVGAAMPFQAKVVPMSESGGSSPCLDTSAVLREVGRSDERCDSRPGLPGKSVTGGRGDTGGQGLAGGCGEVAGRGDADGYGEADGYAAADGAACADVGHASPYVLRASNAKGRRASEGEGVPERGEAPKREGAPEGEGRLFPTEGGKTLFPTKCAAQTSQASAAAKPFVRSTAPGRMGGVEPGDAEAESAPSPVYKVVGAPVKEGVGTVIAVVSGSGGCGKSALSAVLALLAARSGLRTAAFDADFQFGDLDYLLGIPSPLRMEEVVEDSSRLAHAAESFDRSPFLIAAPRRLEVSELVMGHAVAVISALKRAFDVVVVNTGSMWTDGHAGILEACDAVAFVTDSRPSSLRATVHAVELCARMGVATTGFTFVVNRHSKTSLLSAVDVSCALRGSHAVELADGGRDVDELLGAGYPGELVESKNAFVSGVRDLLIEMLPSRRSEVVENGGGMPKKRRSLFGRGDGR